MTANVPSIRAKQGIPRLRLAKPPKCKSFTFIDLFAGIGGFHLAMAKAGGKCLFASEWDSAAATVYQTNFGITPCGDITKIAAEEIPAHHILCAGFPCQAFSISGKQQGFEDTRGTLFFDVARIAKYHQPAILFLENVKNLMRHDGGRTLRVMLQTLEEIGYHAYYKVLNASHYGLPQNRQRLYIVAFRKDLGIASFAFPQPSHEPIALRDILEEHPDIEPIQRKDISLDKPKDVPLNIWGDTHTGSNNYPNKPLQIGKVNKGGQGERIYDISGHGITLSAYGGGVGAKTGLFLTKEGIRRLTPRECARLQGFPEDFQIASNRNQAYQQFGNSVPVKVLDAILAEIMKLQDIWMTDKC